ncbi:unnamed protein product [Arabis nemorensis]|uniref:HhH-GPD domain-containing protein n=1 Tax=Arabis nemorensis TaxID=586526 RepID=A0A565AR35_9BRAS|nr:unnamed protein product [Arabis nemorensis]
MGEQSPSQPSTHTQTRPQSPKPETHNLIPPESSDVCVDSAGVSGSIVSSTTIDDQRITELGNVSSPPSKIPLRPRKIRKLTLDGEATGDLNPHDEDCKAEDIPSRLTSPLSTAGKSAGKGKLSQSRAITVPRIQARSLSCEGELEAAIHHLRNADPLLAALIEVHPPPTYESFQTPFLALIRSILYQQLAAKAGQSIYTRFVALCGGENFVVPETVLSLNPQQLRQIGVSGRKTSYLHDLARKYQNGILSDSAIVNMDDKSLFTMLTMVNGIGSWSVHMFMINSLHRPDVLPVNDLGLRKGVQMLYNLEELPRPSQMEQLCVKWRPYRSVASWYMWRLIEAKGTPTSAVGVAAGAAMSLPPLEDIQLEHQQQQQQSQLLDPLNSVFSIGRDSAKRRLSLGTNWLNSYLCFSGRSCGLKTNRSMDEEELPRSGEEECRISLFDYSVENHLKAVESISDLCGEANTDINETVMNRLSSSVTFLREWRHFNFEPKSFGFYDEAEKSREQTNSQTLPQFSSARAPKDLIHDDESSSSGEPSKDFIMHVGGSVWALEWCPRVHENPDAQANCEFLAVATHPPGSYSHKIGFPLTGRGIIQIWCIINTRCKKNSTQFTMKSQKLIGKTQKKPSGETIEITEPKKPRGRPRKHPIETTEPKKRRGRPRKNTSELPIELDGDVLYVEALSVRYPEESVVPATPLQILRETSVTETKVNNESTEQVLSSENANIKLPVRRKRQKTQNTEESCKPMISEDSEDVGNVLCEPSSDISEDIALPRVVLCLAHNGKVAWDMKWRPSCADDPFSEHRMGYLAVLLGNGTLEVWDVPMPQAISALYSSSKKAATDPRFVKLAPVFRCSKLKCGDAQSIPLTVEWSTLGNPEFLLAGCHDGTVALWKFSTTKSSEDTRPLLFFGADTAPIRAVAWAPCESDQESANVIATAGHGGLKFWDLRDPFRPLWDLHPVPRFIYSLDWLQDPKCVLLSFDDGTLRILSLVKIAYDVPATGKPYPNSKQQGLSVYNCSTFPIWSIQVSRLTSEAAYCTADGSIVHFQLTTKAVEKDTRNRTPHFLCGRFTMNDSTFTVHRPLPKPINLKKPVGETGEKQRCLGSLLNESPNRYTSNVSDVQPLAFAHDKDIGLESETEETNNKAPKPKAKKGKNNPRDEEENRGALVCVKEDGDKEEVSRKEACSSGMKAEGFPPKMVAMHRVRWNMNKGSEKWLCYGGAAGIVRCQEIATLGLGAKPNRRPQR